MQTSSQTPWKRLLKFVTNPTVEVLFFIGVMLVSAWVVIETESVNRKQSAFPVLFGHK